MIFGFNATVAVFAALVLAGVVLLVTRSVTWALVSWPVLSWALNDYLDWRFLRATRRRP